MEGAGAGGVELSPSRDSLSERLGAKDNLFFYNKDIIKKIISTRKAVNKLFSLQHSAAETEPNWQVNRVDTLE